VGGAEDWFEREGEPKLKNARTPRKNFQAPAKRKRWEKGNLQQARKAKGGVEKRAREKKKKKKKQNHDQGIEDFKRKNVHRIGPASKAEKAPSHRLEKRRP